MLGSSNRTAISGAGRDGGCAGEGAVHRCRAGMASRVGERPKMTEKKDCKEKNILSAASNSAPCLAGGMLRCEREHGKADDSQIWTERKTHEPHASPRQTRLPFVSGCAEIPPAELPRPPCLSAQPTGCSQMGAGNNLGTAKPAGIFPLILADFRSEPERSRSAVFDTKFCPSSSEETWGERQERQEVMLPLCFLSSVKLLLRELVGAGEKGDGKDQLPTRRKNLQC